MRERAAAQLPVGCDAVAEVGGVRAQAGDYVAVRVDKATTGTLMGTPLGLTTLQGFQRLHGAQFTRADVAVAR